MSVDVGLPYFGKYWCECGRRSSTDIDFELHNLAHIAQDILKMCGQLQTEIKQEDENFSLVIIEFQKQLAAIKTALYNTCEIKPDVAMPAKEAKP